VTTRADAPLALDDGYVDRGALEGGSKDLQNAGQADRRSGTRFAANQFRRRLPAAAYWRLDPRAAGSRRWAWSGCNWTRSAWRLKIGGRVIQGGAWVRMRLACRHPSQPLWTALATRLRLMNTPG
jgi:hypothetical protein